MEVIRWESPHPPATCISLSVTTDHCPLWEDRKSSSYAPELIPPTCWAMLPQFSPLQFLRPSQTTPISIHTWHIPPSSSNKPSLYSRPFIPWLRCSISLLPCIANPFKMDTALAASIFSLKSTQVFASTTLSPHQKSFQGCTKTLTSLIQWSVLSSYLTHHHLNCQLLLLAWLCCLSLHLASRTPHPPVFLPNFMSISSQSPLLVAPASSYWSFLWLGPLLSFIYTHSHFIPPSHGFKYQL